MRGPSVTGDFQNGFWIVAFAVNELVRNSDFEKPAMNDEASHRPPSLGTGMRPEQNRFPARSKITDRGYQVRCPYPRSRKQDDHIDRIISLHFFKRRSRFIFGCDHNAMFDQRHTGLGESLFRPLHDAIVDKWGSHGIFEAVLMN